MSSCFFKVTLRTHLSQASLGQSLIETIVAIGVLTTGIIGGMALAIYSLGTSEGTISQIIATGLAREGIEVVRNLRDTQWRAAARAGSPSNCRVDICNPSSGLTCSGAEQQCYTSWLARFTGLPEGSAAKDYYAAFDLDDAGSTGWRLLPGPGGIDPAPYMLFAGPDGTYIGSDDYGAGGTRFYRKVTLQQQHGPPFNPLNPRLSVISTVYWTGKNCPLERDIEGMKCKVTLEEYLTNWRNY